MKKKTVILAMPPIFGIYQAIADNLRFHDFEVIEIIYGENKRFTYANIYQHIKKLVFQNILRHREYKKEQLFKPYAGEFIKKIKEIQGKADYCLMFWPGGFPNYFLQLLREKSHLMVHYNWERLEFLEREFYKIRYFDKFLFFDPYDIGKKSEHADKLIPITSFWFDCYPSNHQSSNSLLFIGSHAKQRIPDIQKFYQVAKENGLIVDFHICAQNGNIEEAKHELNLPDIQYFSLDNSLSYKENLDLVQKSGIIIDFLNNKHYGLSLRIFEAMAYDKKLITTNPTIIYYDFYHPDNIFVWNGENIDELNSFIKRPYCPLPQAIKQKYSFENWIRFVFDINPNALIDLPTNLPPQ